MNITSLPQEKQVEMSAKRAPPACIRYCRDWISAPYISLRSGMFKRPKVDPITAAKRVSKESLRKETIPPIRTGMVTRLAIRQMLAAACSHETQVLRSPVHLSRPRAALRLDSIHIVEDLITLLRRQWG